MAAYVAIFTKQADNASYMIEVAQAIRTLAGDNFKRGESAASITAVAFVTYADRDTITKAFKHLWRLEQRPWILPLDPDRPPPMIDQALMTWVDKAEGQ